MTHTTRPAIDSVATIQLWTPAGLSVPISEGNAPDPVRDLLRNDTPEADTRAAIVMARLTGLTVTIRRETQTTVKASDLEN